MEDHQLHVLPLFAPHPATGRTHKRFRWEQTARPVLDETDGRWVVKVDEWREFKRPVLSNGDLVDVVHAVDRHL